jgi:hypothetical protein
MSKLFLKPPKLGNLSHDFIRKLIHEPVRMDDGLVRPATFSEILGFLGTLALNPKTGVALRNALLDAVNTHLGSNPKFRVYDSTQPTDADTALGSQVMLSDHAMSATGFAAAASGQINANAIGSATAAATGTATWYSVLTSANVRKHDGSVGTASANLILNSTAIQSGATVNITAFALTMAA